MYYEINLISSIEIVEIGCEETFFLNFYQCELIKLISLYGYKKRNYLNIVTSNC